MSTDIVVAGTDSSTISANFFLNEAMAQSYSSIKGGDFDSRLRVAAAITDAPSIVDHLGETFELTHFIIHPVELVNEETGELDKALRTVLIKADGTCFSTVSETIVKRLRDLVSILGEPASWPKPVKVKISRVKGNGKNFFYDLSIVTK